MIDPLISIIVPVYMAEKYIERCILSVLQQNYSNFELILVDDGTKDKSGEICDKYAEKDSRVIVLHKNNEGQSVARNIGLDLAKGEMISFLDSDDTLSINFLEIMSKNLYDNDVVLCGINRVYNNHVEAMGDFEKQILDGQSFFENLLNVQKGYGFVWGKLWKASVVKNVKFNGQLKIAEDALFSLEASENIAKVKIIEDKLYNYYFNEQSTVRKFNEKYATNCLISMQAAEKVVGKSTYFSKIPNINQRFSEYVCYHILLIVVNYSSHPQNGKNFFESLLILNKILNYKLFKESIKSSKLNVFSMSRKIPLIALKFKLNFLALWIGKIRQLQFKKIN